MNALLTSQVLMSISGWSISSRSISRKSESSRAWESSLTLTSGSSLMLLMDSSSTLSFFEALSPSGSSWKWNKNYGYVKTCEMYDLIRQHTCPEALIRLSELVKRSVNGFLVQFGHILRICKFWNPEQKAKKVISLFVKCGGEKWGFWPLFWFGLDWNWFSSQNDRILSHPDLNIWSIGWNISM